MEIKINHITRVEGHGNIKIDEKNGNIKEIKWQIPEAPRFFEAMVKGQSWQDIQTIVSRICGICSVTHSLAAVKAIEAAMEIPVSRQTHLLRILSHYTEYIESHSLHLGYLTAPDILGEKSVVPLIKKAPDILKTVINLHKTGNRWMEMFGGRMTHPMTIQPGRMTRLPSLKGLESFLNALYHSLPELDKFKGHLLSGAMAFPDFKRETEYVALKAEGKYSFYEGKIASTATKKLLPASQWENVANEYIHPGSTAKWTKYNRESYAVGALARFNINYKNLNPRAKKAAEDFKLSPVCFNPYMNNAAQLVELYQVTEHAIEIAEELVDKGLQPEECHVEPRAGVGNGCVEAPRGILFHQYEFDKNGICRRANICIPTGQNHGNIQKDLESLVPGYISQGKEKLTEVMEMLVRAYDPCISCSTHYLEVEYV